MTDADIRSEIANLREQLTGELLHDSPIQQQIYELRKRLTPEEESAREQEPEDQGCLYCSG